MWSETGFYDNSNNVTEKIYYSAQWLSVFKWFNIFIKLEEYI